MCGVDRHVDRTAQLDRRVEDMPVAAGLECDIDDRGLAVREAEPRPIGDLPAAAGMQQRAREHDGTRTAVDHLGVELEDVRMLVIPVDRHADSSGSAVPTSAKCNAARGAV